MLHLRSQIALGQFSFIADFHKKHAGSLVAEWGRCKKAGEHYRYPVLLSNGVRGSVFIEGNA